MTAIRSHEVLNVLLRKPDDGAYQTVRDQWQRTFHPSDDEPWRKALRDGVVAETTATALTVAPRTPSDAFTATEAAPLSAIFTADPSSLDGRFANNAWLQELPRPMSKLTWDNAAYVSPRTAARLGLATGDEIEMQRGSSAVRAGVWILPTHADDCFTLPLGYGRTHAGPAGTGVGFDAYRLRTTDKQWVAEIQVRRTGAQRLLVSTQHHARMEGRELVRTASAEEFARNPHFATAEKDERIPDHTLYPDYPHEGYQWGMVIDLNACIGCNACTIACQAENNIPVVGKEEVHRGREMHWIRIDRYYQPGCRPSGHGLSASSLHALRACSLRAGMPGRGHDHTTPRD